MTKFNSAFWKWFGKSVVVDENGDPLEVYHGTNKCWEKSRSREEDIAHWDSWKGGLPKSMIEQTEGYIYRGAGAVWFTDDEGVAYDYQDYHSRSSDDEPCIIKAYLRIENPLVLSAKKKAIPEIEEILTKAYGKPWGVSTEYTKELGVARAIVYDNTMVIKWARENGFDGIIHDDTSTNGRHTHTSYVVFSPNQIKSIDNDGSWDLNDDNIKSNPRKKWIIRAPGNKNDKIELLPYIDIAMKGLLVEKGGKISVVGWEARSQNDWHHDQVKRAIPEYAVLAKLGQEKHGTIYVAVDDAKSREEAWEIAKLATEYFTWENIYSDNDFYMDWGYDNQKGVYKESVSGRVRDFSSKLGVRRNPERQR